MSDRGGSTNPATIGSIKFGDVNRGNNAGRGGSTNPPKGPVGTGALGTKSTNPTSNTGKPEGHEKG